MEIRLVHSLWEPWHGCPYLFVIHHFDRSYGFVICGCSRPPPPPPPPLLRRPLTGSAPRKLQKTCVDRVSLRFALLHDAGANSRVLLDVKTGLRIFNAKVADRRSPIPVLIQRQDAWLGWSPGTEHLPAHTERCRFTGAKCIHRRRARSAPKTRDSRESSSGTGVILPTWPAPRERAFCQQHVSWQSLSSRTDYSHGSVNSPVS